MVYQLDVLHVKYSLFTVRWHMTSVFFGATEGNFPGGSLKYSGATHPVNKNVEKGSDFGH